MDATDVIRRLARARMIDRLEQLSVPEPNSGCHLWLATITKRGYGRLSCSKSDAEYLDISGRQHYAHRISYQMHVGSIPSDLEIDHRCANRGCINPSHLEAVTHRVNVRRGRAPAAKNATKVACARGHAYDAENTYVTKSGNRRCRACLRNQGRSWRERNRERAKEHQRAFYRRRAAEQATEVTS